MLVKHTLKIKQMLKILKLKKNKQSFYENKAVNLLNSGNEISEIRHYPPANKEWFNSIYAYNKDTSKLLPSADKVILKLIKSYFNLYSKKLESKIRSRRLAMRLRKLSTNRILVSKPELKHSNDKVTITIYLYNRQKRYFLNKIKKINSIFSFLRLLKSDSKKIVWRKKLRNLELSKKILKNVKEKVKKIMLKISREKKIFIQTPLISNKAEIMVKENKFISYENKFLKSLVSKSLDKEILRLYFEQILFFNKSKLNNTYLAAFTKLIKIVYKKNIDFNLVNLKYLHLNSYIFTETLVTKLKNKKNKLLRVLTNSLSKFKVPVENKLATYDDIYNRSKTKQNLMLKDFSLEKIAPKDILQEMLEKVSKKNFFNKKELTNNSFSHIEKEEVTKAIFNSIKYKSVSGLRIEAAGRLTRRNTAARSVFKLRYKGNIRNMDSSYKGLSSVLLRGYAKSNVQYTKLKSKIRIGSYGIKG